jgi:hypothetical protein
MQFLNVESAYSALAEYLLAFIGRRSWDKAAGKFKIYGKMAQGEQYFEHNAGVHDQGDFEDSPSAIWGGLDAAIYLRDDLLKTTGQRIWGLTFTLYPDGKFNIDYDYNKPMKSSPVTKSTHPYPSYQPRPILNSLM